MTKGLMKTAIIKRVLFLFSLLPLPVLRGIGALVGLSMLKLSKRASVRLRENLLATGMCTPAGVEAMAKQTSMELGKTLVETACIAWQRSKEYNAKLIVKTTNQDLVEQALMQNQAVLFLTPHIGNFEISLKYTASKIKRSFTVLYKPDKDPLLEKLMFEGRHEDNITPVPTTRSGVVQVVRALQNKQIVGILPDNVASQGDGVWVEFFHKKVFATTLAAKLALMQGVTIFLAYSYRVKHGFELEYIPFTPTSLDIASVVKEIYTMIEGVVRRSPTEYYWSYNRFRVPKGQQGVA